MIKTIQQTYLISPLLSAWIWSCRPSISSFSRSFNLNSDFCFPPTPSLPIPWECDKIIATDKIYGWTSMLFCYQNCSDLLWEKIVLVIQKTFEIRGWRPRICKNFEITRTIYSNSLRAEQFLATECFFNLVLEFSQI